MRSSHIVEHLQTAKYLAEADGKVFLAYLIEMALSTARSSDRGDKTNSAA
ncbi:MAG: hypothetical protein KGI75_27605 [Rhizobiaceae bacterium]|nr:hypothetical protein [Rhizobiaceae bacterium]